MKIFECLHIWLIVATMALLVSCSKEAYETGDSSLSYLKAEMANMHVVGQRITNIVTDNDEKLTIPSSFNVTKSMARTDTTYRAMLYYNKVEEQPIEVKSIKLAIVTVVCDSAKALTLADDPIKLTSIWKAQNNKYLNFSIGLMTGNADSEDVNQKIAFVCDSVVENADGTRNYHITLHHDQASVPEYYTQNYYISLPLGNFSSGDKLCIKMNTYNGWVEKEYMK